MPCTGVSRLNINQHACQGMSSFCFADLRKAETPAVKWLAPWSLAARFQYALSSSPLLCVCEPQSHSRHGHSSVSTKQLSGRPSRDSLEMREAKSFPPSPQRGGCLIQSSVDVSNWLALCLQSLVLFSLTAYRLRWKMLIKNFKKRKDWNAEAAEPPEQMQVMRGARSKAETVTRTDKGAATCSVQERGREGGREE